MEESKKSTYRITIETIGPEEKVFNSGAPLIVEGDGFLVCACTEYETHLDGCSAAHNVTPINIARILKNCDLLTRIAAAGVKLQMDEMLRKEGADA